MRSVVDHYLEAIYTLHVEGDQAFAVTLADLFGVSRANASATVGRLSRDGLVQTDGRQVMLTALGRERAEAGLRRHLITECFLVDVLGMDWVTVHEQARSFESGLSDLLEARMDERLGQPRTCPHGNPIPRPDLGPAAYLRAHHGARLAEAPRELPLQIVCISELIEHRTDLMRFCADHALCPGTQIIILAQSTPSTGAVLRTPQTETLTVEPVLASRIWTQPE